jgi:serine/threonine protein phosphatase PrpC
LQPTRTLGDYYLKKKEYYNGDDVFRGPYLSCKPDVIEHRLTQAHKYLVIASDGLWDVLDHEEVMQSLLMEQEIDLTKTCYDMEENEEGPSLDSLLHSVLDRACENSGKSM